MQTTHDEVHEPLGEYGNGVANKIQVADRVAHRWYRFVLSFPPHLVRDYIDEFQIEQNGIVLDPFCGTGTTLVESKRLDISSIGLEALPMAHFASCVKTNWNVVPSELAEHAEKIAVDACRRLQKDGIQDAFFFGDLSRCLDVPRTLPLEMEKLLLKNSISALPLHKALVLLEAIEEGYDKRFFEYERLALAKTLVSDASNLCFGPEVGVGKQKEDAPVVALWLSRVKEMVEDLQQLPRIGKSTVQVLLADAREIPKKVKSGSVDAVITSPPYPNEKDYSRITRLETVLLGFVVNKPALRELKKTLVRSNTRGVYKNDDDDVWVEMHKSVEKISKKIEMRRIELGKTSGFERQYHRVTKLYFGGMARHLEGLKRVLKPGAKLAYVVGDQASYLRVMIRTGELLAEIAESLGYEVIRTDLFRTRLATATKSQLREEVLVLRWPGK